MRATTQELLDCCRAVLAEYDQQITVRQLYYRLVARQAIPNTWRDYKRLDRFLTRWRKAGDLDPEAFVDLTREPKTPGIWPDLASFLDTVRRSYRRDPWQTQDGRPEVWLEKEALATVVAPVCREWGVILQICRGYPSVSCLFAAARRTRRILYFGDFDPSGQDIPRNIRDELEETWGSEVDLDLIALTPKQIARYELPPAVAKATDSRTPRFVARHGVDTVELDALPPDVLGALLRRAIAREVTDRTIWDDEHEREEAERAQLAEITREIE